MNGADYILGLKRLTRRYCSKVLYKKFFCKESGYPKFKKRGMKDSFRYPQHVKLDEAG